MGRLGRAVRRIRPRVDPTLPHVICRAFPLAVGRQSVPADGYYRGTFRTGERADVPRLLRADGRTLRTRSSGFRSAESGTQGYALRLLERAGP